MWKQPSRAAVTQSFATHLLSATGSLSACARRAGVSCSAGASSALSPRSPAATKSRVKMYSAQRATPDSCKPTRANCMRLIAGGCGQGKRHHHSPPHCRRHLSRPRPLHRRPNFLCRRSRQRHPCCRRCHPCHLTHRTHRRPLRRHPLLYRPCRHRHRIPHPTLPRRRPSSHRHPSCRLRFRDPPSPPSSPPSLTSGSARPTPWSSFAPRNTTAQHARATAQSVHTCRSWKPQPIMEAATLTTATPTVTALPMPHHLRRLISKTSSTRSCAI